MWIPDTVLFSRTQWQWFTSGPVDGDGRLRVRPFRSPGGGFIGGRPISPAARSRGRGEAEYAASIGSSVMARNGTAVEADEVEMMREVRAAFILDLAAKAGRASDAKWVQQKATSRTLCTAWFTDGSFEALTLASFDLLYHRAQWRSQLMALQAVVPVAGAMTDVYSVFIRRKHIEGRLFDDKRERQAAPKSSAPKRVQNACLELHKELVIRLEGVALLDQIREAERLAAGDDDDLSPRSRSPRGRGAGGGRKAKKKAPARQAKRSAAAPDVKVTILRSAFVVDREERCWFVSAESGEVEHLPTAANVADVNAAAKQLRALLAAATKRSVPMKDCYKHFDEHGLGVVARRAFRRGMLRLGLKHSPDIHAALFVRIVALSKMRGAGSEPCFGMREFIKWVTTVPKSEGALSTTGGGRRSGALSTGPRSVRSVDQDSSSAAVAALNELAGSVASTSSLRRIRESAREDVVVVQAATPRFELSSDDDDDDDDGYFDAKLSDGGDAASKSYAASTFGGEKRDEYDGLGVGSSVVADNGVGGARTFTLTGGETLRYQILGSDAGIKEAELPKAMDGAAKKEVEEEEEDPHQEKTAALRIIAFPGLFDSLATLVDFFEPFVASHINWRILILEFPNDTVNARRQQRMMAQSGTLGYNDGGPNKGLNNEALALGTAQLLAVLEARDGWSPDPLHRAAPCIIWGFGNGANVASALLSFRARFMRTLQIGEPGVIRAAILVNAFLRADAGQKRCLQRLLRMAENARHHERMQYLSSLLFSLEYLAENGRSEAFQEFYRTRAPRGGQTELDERVSGLARGALVHTDLRPHFESLSYTEPITLRDAETASDFPIPVIAVAGTGNAFVLPHTTMEIVKVASTKPKPDVAVDEDGNLLPISGGRPPTADVQVAEEEALSLEEWLQKVHLLSLLVEGVEPPTDDDTDLSSGPIALRGSLATSAFVNGGHVLLQEQHRFMVRILLETAKATYVKHGIPPRVLLAQREERRALLKEVEKQRKIRAGAARIGADETGSLNVTKRSSAPERDRTVRAPSPTPAIHDTVIEATVQRHANLAALEAKRDSSLTLKLKAAAARRAEKEAAGDAFARAQAILEKKREAAIAREKEEKAGRAERMLMVQVQKRKREARERRMVIQQLRGKVFKSTGMSRLRIEQRLMVAEDKLSRELRLEYQRDVVWEVDAKVRDATVDTMHEVEEKVLVTEEANEVGHQRAAEREEIRKKTDAARSRFALRNVELPHDVADYMLDSADVGALVKGAALLRADLELTTHKKEEAMQQESGVNALLDNQRRGITAKQAQLKETMEARSMVHKAITTEEMELQREIWSLQAIASRKNGSHDSSDSSFDSEDESDEEEAEEIEFSKADLTSELTRQLNQSIYEKKRVIETLLVQEQELKNELAGLHVTERETDGEAQKVRKIVLQSKFLMVDLHKLVNEAIQRLDTTWDEARTTLTASTAEKNGHETVERKLRRGLEHATKRRGEVDSEFERITRLLKRRKKNHKPTTWVDTEIWQEGIKQRARSDDVLKFLTAERIILEKQLQKDGAELASEHSVIHRIAAVIEKLMSHCLSMQNELHLLRTAWRMRQIHLEGESTGVDALAKEEAKKHQKEREKQGAAALEERQKKQARELGLYTLAARVRAKTHDQRTVEERHWATIDRLVHPDLYATPNRHETRLLREQTEELSIAKLKQIEKLPPALQEALAYLDNPAEIHAHRLICKFTHETDVSMLEAADQRSTRVARQRQAQFIRRTPKELLALKEREWLEIDRKLRPHAYGSASAVDDTTDIKFVDKLRHALAEPPLKAAVLPAKIRNARLLVESYAPLGDGPAPIAIRRAGGLERPVGAGCDAVVVSSLADVAHAFKGKDGVVPVKIQAKKSVTLVRIGCPPISESGRLRGEREPNPEHARQLAFAVAPNVASDLDDTGTLSLELRQRRSHHFVLSAPVSELRVTIMVRGVVDARGYIPGRLSASLYRHLPERFNTGAAHDETGAIPVGFTSHDDVTICTLKSMGRLVIRHRPGVMPIPQGNYEVAVVAASKCSYSITITAKLVYSVEEHVADVVKRHRRLAARIPVAEKELDEIGTTIRLGLRKLKMAKRILQEADTKCDQILELRESLRGVISDPEERDELTDMEAAEAIKRFAELEAEFAVWQRLADGRREEVDDIQTGLNACAEPRVMIVRELQEACLELREIRQDVPTSIAAMAGVESRIITCADWEANVGTRPGSLHLPQWAIKALTAVVPWTHTPAGMVRRKTFAECTKTERRFRKLDKILRPWHWTHEDGPMKELSAAAGDADAEVASPSSRAQAAVHLQEEQAQVNVQFGSHDDDEEGEGEEESIDLNADPTAWTTDKSGEIGAFSQMAQNAISGDYAAAQLARLAWCPLADLTPQERKDRTMMIEMHNRVEWLGMANVTRLRNEENKKLKMKKKKNAMSAAKDAEAGMIVQAEDRAERESQQAAEWLGEICLKKRPIHRTPEEHEWSRYHRLIRPKLYEGAGTTQGTMHSRYGGGSKARGMVDGLVAADIKRILVEPAKRLRSSLERRVQYLMLKYRCRDTFMGATAADRAAEQQRMKDNGELTMDIDTRVRQVLREVDRAVWCTKRTMDSSVYHRAAQRFPTRVLRLELQRYLDELLMNQIKERELELKRQALGQWARERNADLITDLYQGDDVELLALQFGGPGPDGLHPAEVPAYTIEAQRKRLELAVMDSSPDDAVLKKGKDEAALAIVDEEEDWEEPLAPWRATDDLTMLVERKDELAEELAIAMDLLGEPGCEMAECLVLGSAQRGGRTIMPRTELIQDLKAEIIEIDDRIRMQDVDKELHYACVAAGLFFAACGTHAAHVSLILSPPPTPPAPPTTRLSYPTVFLRARTTSRFAPCTAFRSGSTDLMQSLLLSTSALFCSPRSPRTKSSTRF